jgi:hypothetical protein
LPSTLEKMYRARKDDRIAVLAIDIQEDPAKVEAWARDRSTPPILLDRDGAVAAMYRVRATPTVVLVSRSGRLLARATGTRPWDGPAARAVLDAALAAP